MNRWLKTAIYIFLVLVALFLAWTIRWHALTTLNIDYDEDDYLRAGQEYAQLIQKGDWAGFLNTNYRPEHPPLAKILVGISIAKLPIPTLVPDRPSTASPNVYLPRNQLKNGRIANAIFGTLTVGLLAVVDPLAGIFLAVHSFTVKYVSQIMLEALPAFFSLCSVLCYIRDRKKKNNKVVWLVLSAVFLGLTAASKYLYCVAGIAILVDWIITSTREGKFKHALPNILLWGGISLVTFFAFDPYLWPQPIARLKESILFHAAYSTGAAEVENAGFPVWQPFYWLFSTPKTWQPEAIWIAIDPLITLLAIFGIKKQWQQRRVMIIWIIVALIFLLIWPTKWPQYIVILTAPICLTASAGLNSLVFTPIRNYINNQKNRAQSRIDNTNTDWKKVTPWLIPGLIFFLVFAIIPLLFQLGVSLTNFSSISIKDGLNGGIWREVWGGLTGKIEANLSFFQSRAKEVQYIGFAVFKPAINFLVTNGTLFNNFFWMLTSVLFQTLLGVSISLLLWQRGVALKKGWQALFILPWAIPEMIGALMWANVFAPTTGWLSLGVQQYGGGFPFAGLMEWTHSANLFFVVMLISGVWYGFPFMMLATTAGLKMLPIEVFEAAELDGAGGWITFKYVLSPLILPLVVPAMVIRGIFAFNQFYLFQAFHNTGVTLASQSYDSFYSGQYSISAVINIINILILVVLVILLNRSNKLEEGVTYA